MWQKPIYDRTQADIDGKTAKGHYNVDDLNRIEQDCEYLAGAFGVSVNTRAWNRTDFPSPREFDRILNNLNVLRDAYYAYQTTPQTPQNPINQYQKANDLEQILNDLYALYEDNKRAVMYAGESYAGQTIGVI